MCAMSMAFSNTLQWLHSNSISPYTGFHAAFSSCTADYVTWFMALHWGFMGTRPELNVADELIHFRTTWTNAHVQAPQISRFAISGFPAGQPPIAE